MKPRKAERFRAFLGAQVIFNNNSSTVECHIRNISTAGAKLILSPTVSLPEEFDLLVPQKGRSYRCKLRWRMDDSAGVEFVDGAGARGGASAPTDEIDMLRERVRELESDNDALRRLVTKLRGRPAENDAA